MQPLPLSRNWVTVSYYSTVISEDSRGFVRVYCNSHCRVDSGCRYFGSIVVTSLQFFGLIFDVHWWWLAVCILNNAFCPCKGNPILRTEGKHLSWEANNLVALCCAFRERWTKKSVDCWVFSQTHKLHNYRPRPFLGRELAVTYEASPSNNKGHCKPLWKSFS